MALISTPTSGNSFCGQDREHVNSTALISAFLTYKQQGLKNQPRTTGKAKHPTEGEVTQPGGSAQNLQTSS